MSKHPLLTAPLFAKHANRFPNIALFSVDEVCGSWAKAHKTHFDGGGPFDQIYDNKQGFSDAQH